MLYKDRIFAQNWIEQFRTNLARDEADGDTPALAFVREHGSWYDIIGSSFIWVNTSEGQAVWEVREHCSDLMMR